MRMNIAAGQRGASLAMTRLVYFVSRISMVPFRMTVRTVLASNWHAIASTACGHPPSTDLKPDFGKSSPRTSSPGSYFAFACSAFYVCDLCQIGTQDYLKAFGLLGMLDRGPSACTEAGPSIVFRILETSTVSAGSFFSRFLLCVPEIAWFVLEFSSPVDVLLTLRVGCLITRLQNINPRHFAWRFGGHIEGGTL